MIWPTTAPVQAGSYTVAWTMMSEEAGPSFFFGCCPPIRVTISSFDTGELSGIVVEPPR